MTCTYPTHKPTTSYRKGCRCERCRSGMRPMRQRQVARRRKLINEYKLARGCADCGYNEHPAALTFDHLNPDEKEFAIGANTVLGLERVMAEIDKCEVVCANCHAIRTAKWRRQS